MRRCEALVSGKVLFPLWLRLFLNNRVTTWTGSEERVGACNNQPQLFIYYHAAVRRRDSTGGLLSRLCISLVTDAALISKALGLGGDIVAACVRFCLQNESRRACV